MNTATNAIASAASASIDKELLRVLKFSGLHEDNLKDLVRGVVAIQAHGLDKLRVHPIGVPVFNGLSVECFVDRSKLEAIGNILQNTPRLTGLAVFPYGIINPELFRVNVTIGATV